MASSVRLLHVSLSRKRLTAVTAPPHQSNTDGVCNLFSGPSSGEVKTLISDHSGLLVTDVTRHAAARTGVLASCCCIAQLYCVLNPHVLTLSIIMYLYCRGKLVRGKQHDKTPER